MPSKIYPWIPLQIPPVVSLKNLSRLTEAIRQYMDHILLYWFLYKILKFLLKIFQVLLQNFILASPEFVLEISLDIPSENSPRVFISNSSMDFLGNISTHFCRNHFRYSFGKCFTYLFRFYSIQFLIIFFCVNFFFQNLFHKCI